MRGFKWISVIILAALFGCGDCGDDNPNTGPDTKAPWTVEVCENSTDDDEDGRTDCADSDCFTHAACEFEPSTDAPDFPLNGVFILWERSRWMFENGLVQRGVAEGKITPDSIGTVRGRIIAPDGSPVASAAVSVANDPDFGRTYTRADGVFDFAYATTDRLVLRVAARGYITSDRELSRASQAATSLEDIVLVPLQAEATEVDFSRTQLVTGPMTQDEDGARRTAAIFPKGVTASLVLQNGERRELSKMNVRLTEVTVGDDGRQAMMANLPPTTLYTYAAEFTVDEAVEAHAEGVEFSEPVFVYVDNFLGFDAGSAVPSGFYDRTQTVWEPMADGVVLDVVDVSGGAAKLSAGEGPLSDEVKARLGISNDELKELAKLVKAGDSIWRVPTTHFSPFDFNWAGFYPPGTEPPPIPAGTFSDSCTAGQEAGSIIGCSNQTLGEQIALNGTPFALTYQSSRVAGRKPVIKVPVRPSALARAIAAKVTVTAEGQRLGEREFLDIGAVPVVEEFIWDGRDGFGRQVQGAANVEVEVSLVYAAPYATRSTPKSKAAAPTGVTEFPPEFGSYPAEDGVQVALGRAYVVIKRNYTQTVTTGTYDVAREGLGGWTIGPQHRYDPVGRVMYYGNGQDLRADRDDRVLTLVSDGRNAENGWVAPDGSDARHLNLWASFAYTMAVGFDGTTYVTDGNIVRAIDPSTHQVRTVVGMAWPYQVNGMPNFDVDGFVERFGDEGPAVEAPFAFEIQTIRVGRDGKLYVLALNSVWELHDEILTRVAGGGEIEDPADGVGALAVDGEWQFLDVSRDGTIYVADAQRVYRITRDGRIRHVVVPDEHNCDIADAPCGDGRSALGAQLTEIRGIAIGESGDLFIAEDAANDRSSIRKIRTDGVIETIANVPMIRQLEIGAADEIYISTVEIFGAAVFQLLPDGELLARAGIYDPNYDYVASFTQLNARVENNQSAKRPISGNAFALGPNSTIVFGVTQQIVRLTEMFPAYTGANYQIPTPDGARIDEYSPEGRHLATYDALTGTELIRFDYDDQGRLLKVLYRNQNASEIIRDSGEPTQIVGPDGVTWSLTTADGMLTALVSPEGERWEFEYDAGLMTHMINPRGEEWRFEYDEAGRLISDEQPSGDASTLARDKDLNAVKFTSPAGRETTYFSTPPGNGTRSNRVKTGDFETATMQLRDGWQETTTQDGTTARSEIQAHPVYGLIASYAASTWLETPSGLRTEASSTLSAMNGDTDLKSGLESFTRTLTHPRGTAEVSWDRASLTLSSESAESRRAKTVLDADARPVRVEAPGFEPVEFEYDARDRPTRTTQGARSVSVTYSEDGYVESMTGADGTVRLSRDAMGRITRGTRVDLTAVDFAYDMLGNVTQVIPPDRPAYAMSSDWRGNMLSMTMPGGTQETRVFDADRRLTSAVMGDGRGWTVSYDASNRVDRIDVGAQTYDFQYGADAHLAQVAGGEANVGFTWDGPLPTSQTTSGAVNGTIAWTWEDGTLSLGTMSINGEQVDYDYDKDGLPTQIGAQSLTYRSGTYFLRQRKVGSAQVDYTYSDFGELSELRAQASGDVLRVQYTRDDLGRITKAKETVGGTTTTYDYTYDLLGQLSEFRTNGAVSATYSYDANSNRIGVVSAAQTITPGQVVINDDDQLTRYGATTYQYNDAGQLARKDAGSQATQYTYGVMGELEQVVLPDGRTVTYQYDALKRRIGRKINGTTTQRFLWADRLNPVAEVDANGVTTTAYVYGTGINVPDYMVRGGVTYMFVRDHLGSVRFVVDSANGSVAQELRYDAFGQILLDTNPGFQPFGFAGGLYDSDTGLTRFGVRDYDAQTGRWTARDPIAFGGGQANLYAYAGNDAVNFVDFDGQAILPAVVLLGIVGAFAGGVAYKVNTPCRTGRGELGALAGGAISGMFGGASSLALSALALPAVGIALITAALAPMISMIATTAGYAVESGITGEGDSYGFERAIIKGLYTSPTVLAPPLTTPILSPATELTAQHYEMKTSFERGKLKCECGQ